MDEVDVAAVAAAVDCWGWGIGGTFGLLGSSRTLYVIFGLLGSGAVVLGFGGVVVVVVGIIVVVVVDEIDAIDGVNDVCDAVDVLLFSE